jgi:hypothetical protein
MARKSVNRLHLAKYKDKRQGFVKMTMICEVQKEQGIS